MGIRRSIEKQYFKLLRQTVETKADASEMMRAGQSSNRQGFAFRLPRSSSGFCAHLQTSVSACTREMSFCDTSQTLTVFLSHPQAKSASLIIAVIGYRYDDAMTELGHDFILKTPVEEGANQNHSEGVTSLRKRL